MKSHFEEWRPVPSEPGVMASSWGRIRLPVKTGGTPTGGVRVYATKPRAGHTAPGMRYCNVTLRRADGRQETRLVHRLACEAFHGPSPFDGAVVMHNDDDGQNNRPENLRWGSQKDNLNTPSFKAYCRSRTGDKSPVIVGRARKAGAANV